MPQRGLCKMAAMKKKITSEIERKKTLDVSKVMDSTPFHYVFFSFFFWGRSCCLLFQRECHSICEFVKSRSLTSHLGVSWARDELSPVRMIPNLVPARTVFSSYFHTKRHSVSRRTANRKRLKKEKKNVSRVLKEAAAANSRAGGFLCFLRGRNLRSFHVSHTRPSKTRSQQRKFNASGRWVPLRKGPRPS